MSDIVLAARQITKSFGEPEPTTVLHPTDLELRCGECVAVVGRSGAGKSTLLAILGLLDRPTSGELTVAGRSTADLPDRERAKVRGSLIGHVFQSFHLRPRRSVLDNVCTSLIYAETPSSQRRSRAMDALEAVGLADRADESVDHLSGGERQRVAIARAMAPQPQLICADEPTGNLDRSTRDQVMAYLSSVTRTGAALLLVTHDHDVAGMADRQLVLDDGRLASAS